MQVIGELYAELNNALVSAFRLNTFEQMLETKLEQRLDLITSAADDFNHIIFTVISEYNRRDQVEQLVAAARNFNQTNGDLYRVAQALGLATKIKTHTAKTTATPTALALEKLSNDQIPLLSVAQLHKDMMRVERQVCLIEEKRGSRGKALGSGFLIGPSVVLTNYHVIDTFIDGSKAQKLQVRFDASRSDSYFKTRKPDDGIAFAVEEILLASPPGEGEYKNNMDMRPNDDELDFALILLKQAAGESSVHNPNDPRQTKLQRGWMQLPENDVVFVKQKPLLIYQYPGGRELMLAIDTQAVVAEMWDGLRVRYRNNTEPGSSGSPVLDMSWQLVALHHAGEPALEPVAFNQGIPITRIVNHIRQNELGDHLDD